MDKGKRQVPEGLKKVLDFDVKITKQVFEEFDRKFGLQKNRHILKYLEVSCHGLIWIFGVFGMLYFNPGRMELWINLLILLFLDIIIVAVIKVRINDPRCDPNAEKSEDRYCFHSSARGCWALWRPRGR